MPYLFTDYDDVLMKDAYIRGADYYSLIDVCFRYCMFFSFSSLLQAQNLEVIPFVPEMHISDCQTVTSRKNLFIYRCTEDAKIFLKKKTDDFFSWVNYGADKGRPEDLSFYRADGSLFLWSETHEGICILLNTSAEEIGSLNLDSGWQYFENADAPNYMEIPKHIAHFRLPLGSAIGLEDLHSLGLGEDWQFIRE